VPGGLKESSNGGLLLKLDWEWREEDKAKTKITPFQK